MLQLMHINVGVLNVQERFWNDIERRKEELRCKASQYSADQVTIHCRSCKRLLCSATDVCKRGSNYICTDDDFASSVDIKPLENQKDFRSEVHLGKCFCPAWSY